MISQPRSVVYWGGTVSRVTGPALGSTGFAVAVAPLSFFLPSGSPPQVASSRSRARKTTPPTSVSRTIFCLMAPPLGPS
ncbi:hypothetical protein GA0115255_106102 [Streptomyces sp. Ncost-T6T-2b]|nr:hypothetical protein GA0115255_106102 [Streptomyces sp. Ncost-T6T-2b]